MVSSVFLDTFQAVLEIAWYIAVLWNDIYILSEIQEMHQAW